MQLGMVTLGRMGATTAKRLVRSDHERVVLDVSPNAISESWFHVPETRQGRLLSRFRSTDTPYLPALAASTKELIFAVGFQARYANAGRHLESL